MPFPFTATALEPGRYEPEGIYLSRPFPDSLPASVPITQIFGENPDFYRQFTYDGAPLRGHNGIDFGINTGTAVLAADDGLVIWVGYEAGGFGNYVKLQHRWGESLYAHLGQATVQTGAQVIRGQRVGISDNSGASFGPHLHFGIRIFPYVRADGWGGFADPLDYMDPADILLPSYASGTRGPGNQVQLPRMAAERPGMRRP